MCVCEWIGNALEVHGQGYMGFLIMCLPLGDPQKLTVLLDCIA